MKSPALFLDRDGVINVDAGYVHTPEKFVFIPGIFDLVAAAHAARYRVVVVTNQSGIGRGYYTQAAFDALTLWMQEKFQAQGGKIDAVYFCPYHPEGQGIYRRASNLRKPAPGMLLQAARDWALDLQASVFVGDQLSDMQAGQAAGVGKMFLLGKNLPGEFLCIQQLSEILPHIKKYAIP